MWSSSPSSRQRDLPKAEGGVDVDAAALGQPHGQELRRHDRDHRPEPLGDVDEPEERVAERRVVPDRRGGRAAPAGGGGEVARGAPGGGGGGGGRPRRGGGARGRRGRGGG